MPEICHKSLPIKPWMAAKTRKLPGIQPVMAGQWLLRDETFAAQMAHRDTLLATRLAEVYRAAPASLPAQQELLKTVLAALDAGYKHRSGVVTRPDGVGVPLAGSPIIAAARLVQEDLLLLDMAGEPVLNAAVLCFPASWTLDEKFGAGLMGIHGYVDEYDGDMAKRVERMFAAIRPDQPLWRANFLRYKSPELFQPRRAGESKPFSGQGGYVRVERQTLRKLPDTGAVVFGIHTYVVPWSVLTSAEQREFDVAASGNSAIAP